MAWFDEKHVITGNAILLWDGITKPEAVESKPGTFNHNVRVCVPNNSLELAELEQLYQNTLRDSEYKGVLPAGGNKPLAPVDASKFGQHLAGYTAFSAGSYRGAPEIRDVSGAELQPMAYGRMLYAGCVVRLIVNAYAYNNKQKGINFGLEAMQIIDATAPKLDVGGGLSKNQIASAFAGVTNAQPLPHDSQAQTTTPPPATTTQAPPPPPHTGYMETQTAPPPPPVAFPPAGWWPHPQAPGSFYNAQNEVLTEAQLRARG